MNISEQTLDKLEDCKAELAACKTEMSTLKKKETGMSEPLALWFKSCEMQYEFNRKLQDKSDKVTYQLDEGPARALLRESSELLRIRQKHIRPADRSSWEAVQEYHAGDNLADDENNARKIRRAVETAELCRQEWAARNSP